MPEQPQESPLATTAETATPLDKLDDRSYKPDDDLFRLLASPDFFVTGPFPDSPKSVDSDNLLDNLLFRLTVDDPLSLRGGILNMDSLLLQAASQAASWHTTDYFGAAVGCGTTGGDNNNLETNNLGTSNIGTSSSGGSGSFSHDITTPPPNDSLKHLLVNLTNEEGEVYPQEDWWNDSPIINNSSVVMRSPIKSVYSSCDATTDQTKAKQFKFRLKRGGVKHATSLSSEVSNDKPSLSAVSTTSSSDGGPTYWGMWEDERNRMLYVSWLPRSGRAIDRASKKRCELVLKEFIGGILGFTGLEKVLLFPPTSAHCKLLFTDEPSAQRFLTVFGGEGATLWKCLVCRQFGVDIRDGIQSTKVKVIWADQTKNETTAANHSKKDVTQIASRLLKLLQQQQRNTTPNAIVMNAASEHLCGLLRSKA